MDLGYSERLKTCRFCDSNIPGHSQQAYCNNMNCRLKWQQEKQTENSKYWEKREKELETKIESIKLKWIENTKTLPEKVEALVIPSHPPSISKPSDKTVRDLKKYLEQLLETIDKKASEKIFQAPFKTNDSSHMDKLLGSLCAECKGKCCHKGRANHAFLQGATLKKVLRDDPDLTHKSLVTQYLSHIPNETVEGSCLFHTGAGCNLPLNLRANICSEFFCMPLSKFISQHPDKNSVPEHTIALSAAYCDVESINVFDAEGVLVAELDHLS